MLKKLAALLAAGFLAYPARAQTARLPSSFSTILRSKTFAEQARSLQGRGGAAALEKIKAISDFPASGEARSADPELLAEAAPALRGAQTLLQRRLAPEELTALASIYDGERPAPRIAVIGGGISGLSAIHELKKRGLSAQLYESQGRLGGRIKSVSDRKTGRTIDQGAELVNGDDQPLLELIKELNVKLVARDQSPAKQVVILDGKSYAYPAFIEKLFQDAAPQLRAIKRDTDLARRAYGRDYDQETVRNYDRKSISGYLREIAAPPILEKFVEMLINSQYGADYRKLSVLCLFESLTIDLQAASLRTYPFKDEAFRVSGGAQKIIDALARRHAPSVRLKHRLTALESADGKKFSLTFATPHGLKKVEADYVIMTPSLKSTQRVKIRTPGFTHELRDAMSQVRYGSHLKLALLFSRRIWKKLGLSGEGFGEPGATFWDSSEGEPGPSGSISAFLRAGPGAANSRRLARRFLRQLESAFPGISKYYLGYRSSAWKQSYTGPDRPGQRTSLSIPQRPLGNLFWGGEFFSTGSQSYMNGGAGSGQDAAAAAAEAAAPPAF